MTDRLVASGGVVRLNDASTRAASFSYHEWGAASADPLLLLHGFSERGRSYETLAADLADRYRVLALDQRGHGETDWSTDYRWQTFVDQAPGAELRPDALERLVPIVVRPDFESPEELVGLLRAAVPRYREAELRRSAPQVLRQREDGRWVWRFDPALLAPESGAQPPGPEELLAMWGQIRCPTLLVRGAESENLPRDVAERAVAVLRDGRLVDVPSAGHYLPWENPEGLRTAIRPFLAEA
jgi:pimeloyl-ACP methyl ester carboxylesterase